MGPRTLERLAHVHAAAPFTGIADVMSRAALTRADALALARAGALATWEPDRRRAAWLALRFMGDTLPLAPAGQVKPGAGAGPASNRDVDIDAGYTPRPLHRSEAIVLDYHAVGLSVTGHPMERYRRWLRRVGAVDSAELASCREGDRVIVAGLVSVRQRPHTAKGTLFLLLEDETGTINAIVNSRLADENREAVGHSKVLVVYGRAERSASLVNAIGEKFHALDARDVVHKSNDFR